MLQSKSVADAIYSALCKDLDATLPLSKLGDFPDLEQREFAIDNQRQKFLSKFVPQADPSLDREARIVFEDSNNICAAWKPKIGLLNDSESQLVGTFLKYFNDFFEVDLGADCTLDWGNISLHARCGPGVANGSHGTSFFEKMYSGPITASSPYILDLYRADIALWVEETIAEQIRVENFGPGRLVTGSKLTFVPKTAKTSRMIAIEPSLNMFYQLGLGEILAKRLKRFFGIDLQTQPDVNRCLAALGSKVDSTWGDGFATIDLSSASDSLSMSLAGYSIPPDALDKLLSLRSHYGVFGGQERTSAANHVKLHMLSTMGNGFTFPLQTAMFAAIAAASVSQDDSILAMPKAWSEMNLGGLYSCFGDDIIVKPRAYERTLWLLRWLGFRPNPEKCFASGWFRESCGFDFYRGFNVRPFFLRKAKTEQDILVAYNGLVSWAARCLVPIPETLRVLNGILESQFGGTFLVPLGDDSTAGVRVPYSLVQPLKKDRDTQSVSYGRWEPKTEYLRFRAGGKPLKNRRKHILISNPSGLYLSILRGECRSGRISVRASDVEYGMDKRICPNWDYTAYSLQAWFDDYACTIASYPRRAALILEGNLPRLKRIRSVKKTRGRRGR
jgi:hypothetical protein